MVAASCFFHEPFMICVLGFPLQFSHNVWTHLSHLKGLCDLMFCFLAALCRLNTQAHGRFHAVSAYLHLAMALFLVRQEPGQWCCPCPRVVIQGVLVPELSLG